MADRDQIVAELRRRGVNVSSPQEARELLQQRQATPSREQPFFSRQNIGELGGSMTGQTLGGMTGAGLGEAIFPAGGGIPGAVIGRIAGSAMGAPMGRFLAKPSAGTQGMLGSLGRGAVGGLIGEAIPAGLLAKRAIGSKLGTTVGSDIAKGTSELASLPTGQEAGEFRQLIKHPRAILYRWMGGFKGVGRAWKDFTKVLESKGIPSEAVEFGPRETTSSIRNMVLDTMDAVKSTQGTIMKHLKTPDLIKTVRGITEVLSSPLEETRGFGEILKLRGQLMKEIENRGDDIANAWKEVAKSQLAKSFHSPAFGLVPKAGHGGGSYRAFYEMRKAAPFLLGAGGLATRNPELAATALLLSPEIMGLPFAAAGAGIKALRSPRVMTPLAVGALRLLRSMRDQNESQ